MKKKKYIKRKSKIRQCMKPCVKNKQFIDNYHNDFFNSRQSELLFYLIKLEGKQRNKLLNLTDEYYEDKNLAKKWYRDIATYVHPDRGGNNEAFNTLRKIYDILIEED